MGYTTLINLGGLFIAVGLWLHLRVRGVHHRQLTALARMSCPSCHTAYGAEAATEARQRYLDYIRDTRRELPHYRIHFVRCWTVRRPRCSSEAFFRYETAELESGAA